VTAATFAADIRAGIFARKTPAHEFASHNRPLRCRATWRPAGTHDPAIGPVRIAEASMMRLNRPSRRLARLLYRAGECIALFACNRHMR
jgi:hypothetical protein